MSAGVRKGVAYATGTGLGAGWKPKLNRAYAEGRQQYPTTTTTFVAGSPQDVAWTLGYDNRADAAYKRDTAVT